MKTVILVFFATIFLGWAVVRIERGVNFSMNCSQYLKRAADANTIELAQANLKTAIEYAEHESLTNGVVSIFLHQPSNDIGFWYSNLIASQKELGQVTANTTQLEKSNLLMKLRETLTDNSKEGTTITRPKGISIYPANSLFFWWAIIGFGVSGLMFVLMAFEY
ncbi:MAG: hypothetical protein WC497_05515 [Patescibacteria group bacterium]